MMVDATGIEPVTPAMSRQCSTAELRVRTPNFGENPGLVVASNRQDPVKSLLRLNVPLRCQRSGPLKIKIISGYLGTNWRD